MFSTKLGRGVARAATAATTSSTPTCSAQSLAARAPRHPRRHSSSKASCPPDNSRPAPATKAAVAEERSTESVAPARTSGAKGSRGKKSARADKAASRWKEGDDAFPGLPAVPSIQHLHHRDLGLSSFFSLHRPLSLTSTVPPPTSEATFNTLFHTAPQPADPWANGNSAERRPEDVIYTLSATIDSLESHSHPAESPTSDWQILQDTDPDTGVQHLDPPAPRARTLEALVRQFTPFRPPPPPSPFPPVAATAPLKIPPKPLQRSYTATILLIESTSSTGERTYTASSSPITRLPPPPPSPRQPFLQRMRLRALTGPRARLLVPPTGRRTEVLRALSVKRQRRLKMKKHKYKKLMKRTRTLRRKLERA